MRYHDFVLEAFAVPSAPDAGEHRLDFAVRVLSSPAGEMSPVDAVPFGFDWRADFLPVLNRIADRTLDRAGLIAFGTRLAALLLPPAPEGRVGVRELLEASLRGAGQEEGLRLRLRLPPTLAWIPWEYLYVEDMAAPGGMLGFLALNPRIAVLRHETLPTTPPRVEPPAGMLKVAVGLAQAPGTKPLDLAQERQWLTEVFAEGGATPEWLEQTTIGDILASLPHAHIFHFGGHGTFKTEDQGDAFLASNRLGLADKWVGAEQLSMNLRGTPPQVVTLGACFSARRGGPNVANLDESLSAMLIRVGVPVVVGNQFAIADSAAIAFSKGFYQALLGGLSIERAVVAGRLAIYNADPDGRDWGVPVLNMRAAHGELVPGADDEAVRAQARAAAEQIIAQQVQASVAGDNATISAVSVLGQGARGAGRDFIETQNNYIADQGTDRDPDPPVLPAHYLARPAIEQVLQAVLNDSKEDGRPTVVVWGADGSGKGALVKAVGSKLIKKRFKGSVLWGYCAGETPENLLRSMLQELGTRWYKESELGTINRQVFWNVLQDRGAAGSGDRHTLVVFDQPPSIEFLLQVLPVGATRNRVVVISDVWLDTRRLRAHTAVRISQFTPDEAVQIMHAAIKEQLAGSRPGPGGNSDERLRESANYQKGLLQIADAVDYMPGRLVEAATALVAEGLSPASYLKRLSAELASGAPDEATAALRSTLKPEQCEILALCSLFGLNEWHESLLASVALRPLERVREAIAGLLEQGFLTQGAEGHYQVESNRTLKQIRRLFEEQGAYQQQAAWQLFARTCFELVGDTRRQIEDELRNQQHDRSEAQAEVDFVLEFRNRLTSLMPHIRQALRWAGGESTARRLLGRFSDLAYIGFIRHLVWDAGAVYIDLQMATLKNLVLGAPRQPPMGAYELMAGREANADDGRIAFRNDKGKASNPGDLATDDLDRILTRSSTARLEVHMQLTAAQVEGGVVFNADLVHANWTGVRAEDMVWRDSRLIRARFVACTFDYSLWRNCDLSLAIFTGSYLRFVALRDVRMRGADLREADLSYAIMENVDLRGADLTGANLTGARLRNVLLVDATLDNVDWTGASARDLVLEPDQLREVEARRADGEANSFFMKAQDSRDIKDMAELQAAIVGLKPDNYYDLRGLTLANLVFDQLELAAQTRRLDLSGVTLNDVVFSGTELSSWIMRGATVRALLIEGVQAVGAELRAIVLPQALILVSNFSYADLYAATIDDNAALVECVLDGANLYAASLNTIGMLGGSMRGAHLAYSQLNAAELFNVDLEGADLSNAELIYTQLLGTTSLRNVSLVDAILTHVHMRGVDLRGADLSGARLNNVDLTGAEVRDEQLAQARSLRGSILDNGKPYLGHFRLAGDLVDARNELRQQGVAVDDEAVWAEYVERPELLRAFYEQPFTTQEDGDAGWVTEEAPAHGSASLWALERNYRHAPEEAAPQREAALSLARQLFDEVAASHVTVTTGAALMARAAELMDAAAVFGKAWGLAEPLAHQLIVSLRPQIVAAALNAVDHSLKADPTLERAQGDAILEALGRELRKGLDAEPERLLRGVRRLARLRADLAAELTATLADPLLRLPAPLMLCCYAAARIESAEAPRGQKNDLLDQLAAFAAGPLDTDPADREQRLLGLRGFEEKLPGTLQLAQMALDGLASPIAEQIRALVAEAAALVSAS